MPLVPSLPLGSEPEASGILTLGLGSRVLGAVEAEEVVDGAVDWVVLGLVELLVSVMEPRQPANKVATSRQTSRMLKDFFMCNLL